MKNHLSVTKGMLPVDKSVLALSIDTQTQSMITAIMWKYRNVCRKG